MVSAGSATARPRFAVRAVRGAWLTVGAYAVAMAYVESAAVLYLRTLYGGIDPLGPRQPLLAPMPDFAWIEIGREAATMIMLGAVAWLAGHGGAGRLGAFAVAMGVWDIFYYVFLWLFAGWPASLLAGDVLFLIPLPWWGPVLAPVLLALLLVVAGAAAMARALGDGLPGPGRWVWLLLLLGGGLCLLAFMLDAVRAVLGGRIEAAYLVRGGASFSWPLFLAGLGLGGVGLVRALTRRS